MDWVIWGIGGIVAIGLISWVSDLYKKANLYDELKPRLDKVEEREKKLLVDQRKVEKDREAVQEMAKEKSIGFPWLARAYADYFQLQDLMAANYLLYKPRPARKAAEVVKEISHKRHSAEKANKILQYQLDYYETLFPFLVDYKEEGIDDYIRQEEFSESYDYDTQDPVRKWLTAMEYSSLSTADRNQLALERYWTKKKSKWEIGRDYERFVGYLYEVDGWQVCYQGITEGLADLGRDLIVTNGDNVTIIQCKYWSTMRTIHEKHLFQLFGTYTLYRLDHKHQKVSALFVTSTNLTDRALTVAQELGITVSQMFPMRKYPCVKCNISKQTGERIYHLPFDQQYDRTIIDISRNERYAWTAYEAESWGFRRAFRWHGEPGYED